MLETASDSAPTSANNPIPNVTINRRRSIAVGAVALLAMLLLNWPGNGQIVPNFVVGHGNPRIAGVVLNFQHGWPTTYLERLVTLSDAGPYKIASGRKTWHPLSLLGNLLVAGLVVAAAVCLDAGLQRKNRLARGLWWMLLIWTPILILGWFGWNYSIYRHEQEIIQQLPRHEQRVRYQLIGGDWLKIVPGATTPFRRAMLVEVKNPLDAEYVNQLDQVRWLIVEVAMQEPALKHLKQLKHLEVIQFAGLARLALGDAELETLAQVSSLEYLELGRLNATARGLAALATLPELQGLDISAAQLQSGALAELAKSATLESLSLADCKLNADMLRSLAAVPRLQQLDLAGAELGAEGLEALSQLANLETLDLSDTDISEAALMKWQLPPNLRQLTISEGLLDEENLKKFEQHQQLSSLRVRVNSAAGDAADRNDSVDEVPSEP